MTLGGELVEVDTTPADVELRRRVIACYPSQRLLWPTGVTEERLFRVATTGFSEGG